MNFQWIGGRVVAVACMAATVSSASADIVRIEVGTLRERQTLQRRVQQRLDDWHQRVGDLTRQNRRKQWRGDAPFSMPQRVELTSGGKRLLSPTRVKASDLTLTFDTTFPTEYRTLLSEFFTRIRPALNAQLGAPQLGGNLFIRNSDPNLSDREVVTGGRYLPDNGAGQREIQFPIYSSPVAAQVNFLHCLALAYQGNHPFEFDAFQEGLIRAAVLRIARANTAQFSGDPAQTLFNTYDVEEHYDWYNQRALGGTSFIAPNLLKEPLPIGGSFGGLYLLRYRMAGSAWQKVLVEYPSFAAEMLSAVTADPTLAGDRDRLVTTAGQILQRLRPTDPTVEGLPFAEWFRRQWILDTRNTAGNHLLVQPTPILDGLSGPDFGVFNIEAHWFGRTPAGNETLLSGTSFPIFWESDFSNRLLPSAQDERMSIAGAYGSVGPNFTDSFGGQVYRVAVDIPVQDHVARVYLPAGAIATPGGKAATFYGTISGITTGATGQFVVRVKVGTNLVGEAVVQNNAFTARFGDSLFTASRSLTVELIRKTSPEVVVLSRRVNKGPGGIGLELRVDGEGSFAMPTVAGIQGIASAVDPYAGTAADILGIPADDLMLARYNATKARYDLFPDVASLGFGTAFLHRATTAQTRTITGRRENEVGAIALRPGWNLVSFATERPIAVADLRVVAGTGFPQTWAEASGTTVGADVFGFSPGGNDPITGIPETGSFKGATTLEAGKCYFVRCLASTGAVIYARPLLGPLPARRNAGPPAAAPRASSNGARWAMRMVASGPDGEVDGNLVIHPQASSGADAKWDSPLPPGIGGFQLVLEPDAARLRSDARPPRGEVLYRFRMEGLRRGREYRIQFVPTVGYTNWVNLWDPTARKTFRPGQFGVYRFTARKTAQDFTVRVVGY